MQGKQKTAGEEFSATDETQNSINQNQHRRTPFTIKLPAKA